MLKTKTFVGLMALIVFLLGVGYFLGSKDNGPLGNKENEQSSSVSLDQNSLSQEKYDSEDKEDDLDTDDSTENGTGSVSGAIGGSGSSGSSASSGSGATTGDSSASSSSQSSGINVASFSMAEVSQHNGVSSCYTAVGGSVYNLTSWIAKHPGGESAIKSMCGKDSTSAFLGQHGGQDRPEKILDGYKIGILRK